MAFDEEKRKLLLRRRKALLEELDAAENQHERALSDVDKVRLLRQIDHLFEQIREVDAQIARLGRAPEGSSTAKATPPTGQPEQHDDASPRNKYAWAAGFVGVVLVGIFGLISALRDAAGSPFLSGLFVILLWLAGNGLCIYLLRTEQPRRVKAGARIGLWAINIVMLILVVLVVLPSTRQGIICPIIQCATPTSLHQPASAAVAAKSIFSTGLAWATGAES